jgi:hypothetical protein
MTVSDPDPNALYNNLPAIVDVESQGPVFVAHATTLDNGWLRVREWNGTSAKLPPHRVKQVRYLETERHGEARSDGMKPKRLADRKWRERAREWAADETDDQRAVVA